MTPSIAVVPQADPVALPAPVWLLQFLLLLTFTLHVVPMSMMLGGGFWAIVAARSDGERFGDLSRHLSRWLPVWTAAAITTGVAALLFLQVLYGQLFYPAGVAMAWPWLSVILVLLVGYYAYYVRDLRGDKQPSLARAAGVVGWLCFLLIAFIYVNVMTLMLDPERITAKVLVDARGWSLNLDEPMLWPRYLHMVLGATAVAALWVAVRGAWQLRRQDPHGAEVLRFAARGFVVTTFLQIAAGLWFVVALPGDLWRMFVGGDLYVTAYVVLALLMAIEAAWILWRAPLRRAPLRRVIVASAHLAVVLVLMILVRDWVRRALVRDAIAWHAMPTEPQWSVIAIFFALLAGGLATLVWMLRAVRR